MTEKKIFYKSGSQFSTQTILTYLIFKSRDPNEFYITDSRIGVLFSARKTSRCVQGANEQLNISNNWKIWVLPWKIFGLLASSSTIKTFATFWKRTCCLWFFPRVWCFSCVLFLEFLPAIFFFCLLCFVLWLFSSDLLNRRR